MGYNVPDDFGILRMEPATRTEENFGAYIYVGADGRWVLRNIFLDGNTFQDSHHVSKEDLVGEVSVGIGLSLKKFDIIYMQTYRSREFEKQDHSNIFRTASISFSF